MVESCDWLPAAARDVRTVVRPRVPVYPLSETGRWSISREACSVVETYESFKDVLAPFGQVGRSIAHIHIGLALFVGGAVLSRRGYGSAWLLLVLFGLELVNEAADIAEGWPHIQSWRIRDTIGDVVNTMLWPVILYVIAKVQGREHASADVGMDVAPPD